MEVLAAFGPAGAVVAVVLLFLKYLQEENKRRDLREAQMEKSIKANTRLTSETYKFMKNLNGELKKAALKKLEV